MCGIAGFTVHRSVLSGSSRTILESMLGAISYRGPDQRDMKLGDNIVFGHNRLTIMEPQGGTQPRVHPESRNTLIYNGEIYGHRSFDSEINGAGHELRDHCDTETLFWLIEMHGVEKAVSMLDGMFAFAYHETATDTVYLARDVFGQKPLFYAEANGELIFGSEIKALLKHPSLASRSPDIDALSLYLMMEYIPGPRTGILGISELQPGHVLTYTRGRLSLASYQSVSNVIREEFVDEHQAVEQFDCLLSRAIEQQLVADAPVGIFLSGGLDSSLIAAMAKRHRSDVATFTIKFPQASFDESIYAEEVAKKIGTRHTTIALSRQNCVDGIQDLLKNVDQPFADSSLLPTHLLCQATRQHVSVALGGDGADELLLGYPNFKVLRYAKLLQRMPHSLGKFTELMAGRMPQSTGYMNAAFLLRQLSYGFGVPANMQSIYWMSAIAAREQNDLWIGDQARDQRIFDALSEQVISTGGVSLFESCQQHFLNFYLPFDILRKTDRASMYNSLEVRAPYLSSAVAQYALSLPHAALYRRNTGKRILRSVAQRYLPRTTIGRRKHGFALPVSSLIRDDLRGLVETVLLDHSNPMYAYLHRSKVLEYWDQHISEKKDQGKKLWALFMLASFFNRQFHSP